jgi:hypothetical protein
LTLRGIWGLLFCHDKTRRASFLYSGIVAMTAETPIILRASPQDFIEIACIEKFNDGSGYTSRLSVGSGRFSCSGHPFYFDDLKGFTSSLTHAFAQVVGKARLGHNYEKDFVEIEILRGGHVKATGFIQVFEPDRQELRFCFVCDQTFLPDLLSSLKRVDKELKTSN